MNHIQVWSVVLVLDVLFGSCRATPPESYKQSPLMREVEMKKALYYYNKTPLRPQVSEIQRRSGQSPAEERIFIKPYKFPFWGLPYGIYSKGGFFNPGLFPFVPGGPGFPPYDGIFGSPWGPGQYPGYPASPFMHPTTPAPMPKPAPKPEPSPLNYTNTDDSYEHYYVHRKPKKKKPPPPPKYNQCSCPYSEDDFEYDADDTDCNCSYNYSKPKETVKPKPRPNYSARPYRKPKKVAESSYYRKPPSAPPCKYGYASGPKGGCKRPPPREEQSDCGKRYRGKCPPKPKPKPKPYAYYYDEEVYDESEDAENNEGEEDEMTKVFPQYIPIYVPYPPQGYGQGGGYYPPPNGDPYSPYMMPYPYPNNSQQQPQPQPPQPQHQYFPTPAASNPTPAAQYQYQPQQPMTPNSNTGYSQASSNTGYPQALSTSGQGEPQQIVIQYTPVSPGNPPELPHQTIHYTAIPPGQQQQQYIQYKTQPQPSPNVDFSGRSASQPVSGPITIQYTAQPLPEPQSGQPHLRYANPTDLATSSTDMNTYILPHPHLQLPFQVVYKPPKPSGGFLFQPEVRYKITVPQPDPTTSTTTTTSTLEKMNTEKNLRVTNAEDPFIANHLNHYTAASMQMPKKGSVDDKKPEISKTKKEIIEKDQKTLLSISVSESR